MPGRETSRRIGLARALSKLGYCSRSQAVQLVQAGRVQLNGETCRNPEMPARLERDRIAVDGRAVEPPEKIYLAMNKPRGLVTTTSDEKGRETVYSILATEHLPWVAPVGRLDKASEGMLLLTNDSEWGARVAAPETQLEKTYHVQINRLADEGFTRTMTRGIRMRDGEFLRAARCQILRSGEQNCWLEVALDEGKNRQIRRMLETLGVEVLRLVRVAIGPLQLGNLSKGTFRRLTAEEKQALDRSIKKEKTPTTEETKDHEGKPDPPS